MKSVQNYQKNVFINCPFDKDYDAIFNAILFTVHKCGFILRCSKEFDNSNSIRIKNIVRLIKESQYSIHDLSRVTLSGTSNLPRFNMPLELGIFIGAIEFGSTSHRKKEYIVLESDQFRFKQFISDISGSDIKSHEGKVDVAIKCVRDWLSNISSEKIPSASKIVEMYHLFSNELPELCSESKWIPNELTFEEYSSLVTNWLLAES